MVLGNEIIGIANSIPFYRDKAIDDLPDTGWDWVLEKGIEDFKKSINPNVLCGLQIAAVSYTHLTLPTKRIV